MNTSEPLAKLAEARRVRQAEAMSNGAGGNVSIQSTDVTIDGDDGSRSSAIRCTTQSDR